MEATKQKQEPEQDYDDNIQKNKTVVVGVKGVQLKRFEQVVATLLRQPQIDPTYGQLPPVPTLLRNNNSTAAVTENDEWPFDNLPNTARVYGNALGQLSNFRRAKRKEEQIRSILRCIFALLPNNHKTNTADYSTDESSQPECINKDQQIKSVKGTTTGNNKRFTIVDFGGGSGHLGIPLALLLPGCRVVVVDLNEHSLALMHNKAAQCCDPPSTTCSLSKCNNRSHFSMEIPAATSKLPRTQQQQEGMQTIIPQLQVCAGIPNLFSFHGSVHEFQESFDMAVALHLCGEATDVVLRLAGQQQAQSCIVSPCCVGKLSVDNKNPYIYQATGSNTPTVSYPQSSLFSSLIGKSSKHDHDDGQEDWNALAKAADYSSMEESRTSRNAARRTAKALLETDRRFFLEETYGYQTALVRMDPWEATPKNDILLAWRSPSNDASTTNACVVSPCLLTPDTVCQADIQQTRQHLLDTEPSTRSQDQSSVFKKDGVDWTWEEEEEIRQRLSDFVIELQRDPDSILIFPTHLGGRKRKLVHYMAAQMKLAHWSEGRKDSEKTVAVALRRKRSNKLI